MSALRPSPLGRRALSRPSSDSRPRPTEALKQVVPLAQQRVLVVHSGPRGRILPLSISPRLSASLRNSRQLNELRRSRNSSSRRRNGSKGARQRHGVVQRRRLSLIARRHFLHCRYSDHSKQKPRVATTVCQLPAAVSPQQYVLFCRARVTTYCCAPVHQLAHSPISPAQGFHQARHQLTQPARPCPTGNTRRRRCLIIGVPTNGKHTDLD